MKKNSAPRVNSKFCLLCNKEFASAQNLKRHNNYAHKLCEPPSYVCNFCNTGFVNWEDYEHHHNQRLLKTFSRKKKKRAPKEPVSLSPTYSLNLNPSDHHPVSAEEDPGKASVKIEEEADSVYSNQQPNGYFYIDQQ